MHRNWLNTANTLYNTFAVSFAPLSISAGDFVHFPVVLYFSSFAAAVAPDLLLTVSCTAEKFSVTLML